MVGDFTRMIREASGRKPIWMTLQIAWSGVIKPGKTLRFPTFAEERFTDPVATEDGARAGGAALFGESGREA